MRIIVTFIVFCFGITLIAGTPVINKSETDLKGTASVINQSCSVSPVSLPEFNAIPKEIVPYKLSDKAKNQFPGLLENTVIASDSLEMLLYPGDYTYFEFDTRNNTVTKSVNADNLTGNSLRALARCPKWLTDQLRIKLNELHKYNTTTENLYADLINNAEQKIVDEVAFTIANMSVQSLTDSRFMSDKEAIVRNASMIYKYADSLKYVKIVEHGDFKTGDYFTTTSYRIYDPTLKDTVWSEIPRDIYYWYIVHPKMDQEGVYVADNGNDASGQRTYGFAWRDFIWNNPDNGHDYTNVNKTTSKGTISTIPRFGDLIKNAEILWDRNQTYYTFNRPFNSSTMALDIIGNWCSRAIPVDVTLPRSFQPNQILMKHDGMCNEDAFLVAATCRTALIPIIYLGTWSEDHVFGSVWEQDWNHFEFFRGGLAPSGNQFYGITNLLPRGSYGWTNAMVQGFRPDGYAINFTPYYANTATLNLKVSDSTGTPVEGALITLYSSPNGSTGNYIMCGTAYTDEFGSASIKVGEKKKFLAQVWHPKFGWAPADSTQAYVILGSASVSGRSYSGNIAYQNLVIKDINLNKTGLPPHENFGINVKIATQDVLTAQNKRDSQNSRFYLWNEDSKGLASIIICDSINFEKFKNKVPFDAFEYYKYVESGDFTYPLPPNTKWYAIISNHVDFVHLQKVKVQASLVSGDVTHADESEQENSLIYPNPFSGNLNIVNTGNLSSVEIFDVFGNKVASLNYPFHWEPQNLSEGVYTVVLKSGKNLRIQKAIHIR